MHTPLATNRDRLVTQRLRGEVWPPTADRHGYRVDANGQPFLLPGMAGVTLGVHPGDIASGWASDHLEPGLSIRHRDVATNQALQFLTCVGNVATIESGPAAGAKGRVIGQHAFVLADFADNTLEQVHPGDSVTIDARGQGLRLTDHPHITVKNCAPELLASLGAHTDTTGRLAIGVTTHIPPEAIGAGAGMTSEFANTDLMGVGTPDDQDPDLLVEGLDHLRIGDLVLLQDQDHSYGRGWRPGWVTIGVISTGHCRLFGHGPGPSSLLSGPTSDFSIHTDPDASLLTAFNQMEDLP